MGKSMDEIWERIHSTREWGAYPSEHVVRFVARNYYSVENRNKIKILDFGCGQGANTWYLTREGFDVYAFDGSKSAVEKAEIRLKKENLRAVFDVYDGTEIGYQDNMFDAVIDNACIYSNKIDDIKTMYKNVYRVLKQGGKFFSICFGENQSGYKTGKEIEPHTYTDIKEGGLRNAGVQHIFTKKEICEELTSIGFKNVICEEGGYTDRGQYVHHYICMMDK